MNYQKIYNDLIKHAKMQKIETNQYVEVHHIIPRSLNGSDDNSNLVSLTARQHYIAHMLLVKIAEMHNDLNEYKKMLYAFNCMKWGRIDGKRAFRYNSRLYQQLKEKFSELRITMMSINNPMHGKIWICNYDLEESKIWNAEDPLPDGWVRGRHSREQFKQIKNKIAKLELQLQEKSKEQQDKMQQLKLLKNKKQKVKDLFKQERILRQQFEKQKQQEEKEQKKKLIYAMFEEFKKNEFEGVVKKFGYKHTRNNLIMAFKANIPEYIPKVCNRWKNRK